jgi:hypothetical protein
MSATSARAIAGSRYSSTYFIDLLFGETFLRQLAHYLESFVSPLGFLLIHAADGITDVNKDVVTDGSFGHEIETNRAGDAAELDAGDTTSVYIVTAQHSAWNRQTHGSLPPPLMMMAGHVTTRCDACHAGMFTVNVVTRLTGKNGRRG